MWVNSLIMLLIIMYCFAFSNEYFHPTETLNKVIHKKSEIIVLRQIFALQIQNINNYQ